MLTRLVGAVGVLCLPAASWGQGGGQTSVELRASGDALSGNRAAWQEHTITLRYSAATRTALGATLGWLRRFGASDRRLSIDGSLGVGSRLTLGVEAEASPTHHVVASAGGAARVHVSLAGGWGVEGRVSAREFEASSVRGGSLALERYWSRYLASYAVTAVRLTGGPTVMSHGARLSRFWGDRGSVTIGAAAGREVEHLGETTQLLAMKVRSLSLWGTQAVGPRTDLTFATGVTRQGELFNRVHGALGIRLTSR
jgi:YaiO family outer membrane protein